MECKVFYYFVVNVLVFCFIVNIVASISKEIVQSALHVSTKLISKLISDISKVLRKLLEYFNGVSISTFLVL